MLPLRVCRLLFFVATTTAAADTATWLFPAYVQNAPLVTFENQDTIDASWTSSFVAPVLSMFCETSDSVFAFKFRSPAPVLPNGTYAIPLDSVQDTDSGCHLNLNETNGLLMGTGNSSNSGNFLVYVLSDRPATTWSTSIASATTSSSSSASTAATTPASTSSPPSGTQNAAVATATDTSVSAQTNTGLSSGAKAGIGVGVTLGVLALILAGLLLWMRARRKQRRNLAPGAQKQAYGGGYASEVEGDHAISEMDGRNAPEAEKDGFPIARRQTAGELEAR